MTIPETREASRGSPFATSLLFQCRAVSRPTFHARPCPRAKFPYYAHDATSISFPSILRLLALITLLSSWKGTSRVATFVRASLKLTFSGLRTPPHTSYSREGAKSCDNRSPLRNSELILKYASKRGTRN